MKPTITAIVYDKRGKVLSTAQNSYVKTHPLQAWAAKKAGQEYRIYLHAEVAALLKCDWNKAHSILVTRYNSKGQPMPAAPCEVCQEVIKKAGIKHVRHT